MSSVQKNPCWLVLVAIIALTAGTSFAADKPAKDPSKRLQQQLRQAEQEKAQLNQKVAEAETQLKDVQEKSTAAKRQADEASGRAARLSKELDNLRTQSAEEKQSLTAKLAETERKLADLKQSAAAEKQQMESNAARQRTALAGCSERNARMYKLGNELLDKYAEKSCFTSVLQSEPFTGLKRAQIEKFVEEEREKLDKDELIPAIPAQATQRN
jgi:chromosome segregation ATPase